MYRYINLHHSWTIKPSSCMINCKTIPSSDLSPLLLMHVCVKLLSFLTQSVGTLYGHAMAQWYNDAVTVADDCWFAAAGAISWSWPSLPYGHSICMDIHVAGWPTDPQKSSPSVWIKELSLQSCSYPYKDSHVYFYCLKLSQGFPIPVCFSGDHKHVYKLFVTLNNIIIIKIQ